jgi:A/G-specific adenine glycosylase
MQDFAPLLIRWQKRHGRHDLPWQNTRDAYRIWLSEIMLQQTQVATVLGYYVRFLERFPDLAALAGASPESVLQIWSGLGYYSRARNLHRCAQAVIERHGGVFPDSVEALEQLPGIGPSTAAAIAVFAYGRRAAILDGNVKRVLLRLHGIEADPNQSAVNRRLWELARQALPALELEPYTQGLMDLGATVCLPRRPQCGQCPVAGLCVVGREGGWERIPAPRRSRPSPERVRALVILIADRRVLLEERPPDGIWGGLLSLPEFDPLESAELALGISERFGWAVDDLRALPVLRHAFTHFRLLIRPWFATLDRQVLLAAEPKLTSTSKAATANLRWLPLTDVADAALPRPVKRLLLELPS